MNYLTGKLRLGICASIIALGPTLADASEPASLQEAISVYEAFSAIHPMEAGRSDLTRSPDGWPRETPEAMDSRREALEGLLEDLQGLAPEDAEDALNKDYLEQLMRWRIDGLSFDERRFAFVAHDGFYNLPYYEARNARPRTVEAAEAWLERLERLPQYFQEQQENLERGVATGWTQPEIVVDVAVTVLSAQTARPINEDTLLDPIRNLPQMVTEADRSRLVARGLELLEHAVRPAQTSMLGYIDGEYRAAARSEIGVSGVPKGRAYYDYLLSYYTTTDMTAEEIHDLGQSEIVRIREAMDEVIESTGFEGGFEDWLEHLRTDPQFYATSRQELLDRAAVISKRIDAQLPAWFSVLPRQPFAVEPVPRDVEENYTTARYSGADFSAGLPGRFLVNTSHLSQRPLYELPALALHEAAPGHHTHTALSRENPDLPSFRQARDMLAYREGWALYAERLGHEMGIYQDAYERFGSLSMEMWRACRMVVDTGMHVLGWSYEQARACFTDNTALADVNIDSELARYIGAPAGAVAYKVGELKIIELRRRAEDALGEAFDIRLFHDLVLAQGQIPLTLLDEVVDEWIAQQQAGAPD